MTEFRSRKTIAAAAIAASTLGGAAAGAAFLAPGGALAQDDTGGAATTEEARPAVDDHIAEALQGLVDDGTLTTAQVDAVIAALDEARPDRGDFRGGRGPGGSGQPGGPDGAVAEVLGMEQSELGDALRSGQSLAAVAAANGVDVQDVIDAIVDATGERVAEAVENGRIDQERADEILGNAEDRAAEMVEREPGSRVHPDGPDDTDPAEGADTDSSAPSDESGSITGA